MSKNKIAIKKNRHIYTGDLELKYVILNLLFKDQHIQEHGYVTGVSVNMPCDLFPFSDQRTQVS